MAKMPTFGGNSQQRKQLRKAWNRVMQDGGVGQSEQEADTAESSKWALFHLLVSRESKFGYGFLLAGVGMPYLVEKFFGELPAMIIAAVCLMLGICLLVAGHLHEKASSRNWSIAIVAIVLLAATLAWRIREYARPSFAVLKPILWTLPSARSTEIFIVDEIGHESLYDVEVVVQDDDRVVEMKRNPARTPELLPAAFRTLKYPEMDPGPQIDDKWLFVNPLIPSHQHYTVYLSFRGNPRPRFQEDVLVEVPHFAGQKDIENMAYAIRISDFNANSVILECRDLAFPASSEWGESLATCLSIFRPLPSQKNLFTRARAKFQSWRGGRKKRTE